MLTNNLTVFGIDNNIFQSILDDLIFLIKDRETYLEFISYIDSRINSVNGVLNITVFDIIVWFYNRKLSDSAFNILGMVEATEGIRFYRTLLCTLSMLALNSNLESIEIFRNRYKSYFDSLCFFYDTDGIVPELYGLSSVVKLDAASIHGLKYYRDNIIENAKSNGNKKVLIYLMDNILAYKEWDAIVIAEFNDKSYFDNYLNRINDDNILVNLFETCLKRGKYEIADFLTTNYMGILHNSVDRLVLDMVRFGRPRAVEYLKSKYNINISDLNMIYDATSIGEIKFLDYFFENNIVNIDDVNLQYLFEVAIENKKSNVIKYMVRNMRFSNKEFTLENNKDFIILMEDKYPGSKKEIKYIKDVFLKEN